MVDGTHVAVNFFSSPAYLACVADAYFPGRSHELVDYAVEGATYRLLRIRRSLLAPEHIVTWVPFMDMLEPVTTRGRGGVRYLPLVSHGRWPAAEGRGRAGGGLQVSPLIDYTAFPTWDAFVAHARTLGDAAFRSNRAKQLKKLDAEHGAALAWNDEHPEALAQLMRWKSQQYRESGYIDGFQSRALVRLFELLRERGQLVVTTLRLGGAVVAGHAGAFLDGRFYYWLPAYDAQWAKRGVGTIINEWMMEQAYRRGAKEFDFLLGDEAYKWNYATHTRLVGPLGVEPLRDRLWRPVRARVMAEVRKRDGAYRRLQELKRRAMALKYQLRGK